MHRITQFTFGDLAQPLVLLAQYKGQAAIAQTCAIALKNRIADVRLFQGEMAGLRSQMRADGQSHQVVGIGKRMSFVKIVDTPDETAFAVAPRSEIFYVEIAYGQHVWRLRQIGADL